MTSVGALRIGFDPKFRKAIEVLFSAEIKVVSCQRGRRAEAIVELIDRQDWVFPGMLEHDRGAVPTTDVDPIGGSHGRGENKIAEPFQAQRFAAWFAANRIQAR